MIGMRTILQVADNSGARRLACILPVGGDVGLQAGLGDVVTASVKEAAPDSAIPKGKVMTYSQTLTHLIERQNLPFAEMHDLMNQLMQLATLGGHL